MADLLPDIPSDLWNSWSADQFAQAAQEKIAGIPGDIATGVQNIVSPPPPPPPPAPEPAPEPPPEPAPAPPPPPPPPDSGGLQPIPNAPATPDMGSLVQPIPNAPAAPPDINSVATPIDTSAPTDTAPAPTDTTAPAPDLSTPPAPTPPPPAPTPPPATPQATTQSTSSSAGFDPFGSALNAASAAGADVGQFAQNFGTMLDKSGGDVLLAGINATSMAGGDVQQFADNFNDTFSKAQQLPQQQQTTDQQQSTDGRVFPVTDFKGPVQDHWGSVLGGSDLMAPRGTPVVVMEGGKVLESGWDNVGGNSLLIQGNDGNQYYYAHFDSPSDLKVGQQVNAGTYVAPVGNTGDASGGPTHLHIGIGPDIKLGADKYGGTGGDYNAVGLLQQTLDAQRQGSGTTSAAGPSDQTSTQTNIQGPMPKTPGDLIDQARQAAINAGIDPDIFARQIQQESGFNPNAKSGAGAIGIAQFMPGTAQGMGIDPTDPQQSLLAAAKLDAQNLAKYGGDWSKALAAYNAGGGNVDKYGGVPPFQETQSYVNTILGGAKNVVQQGANAVQQAGQSVVSSAGNAVSSARQQGQDLLSAGDDTARNFSNPASDWLTAQGLTDTLSGAGSGAQDLLSQAGLGAQSLLDRGGVGAGNLLSQADQGTTGALNQASQSAQDLVSTAQQRGQDLTSAIQQAPDAAAQIVQQVAGSGAAGVVTAASNLGQNLTPLGLADTGLDAASRVANLQPGASTDLGPLTVGPMPSDNSRIPLTIGGVDIGGITGLNAGDVLTQALLGDQANTLPGQTLQQALTPTNYFFGPYGLLAGLVAPTGSDIGGGIASALGGDQTAQGVGQFAGALGLGLLAPAALERLGPAALDLLSDPSVQAALRYRQAGESDINFALGGLPSLFSKPEEALPENASNAARAVYSAATQANVLPASGAGLLQRAMDALSAYPEEVSGPIRQFATATDAPASEVANTIQRWMLDNPTSSVPDPFTGPSTLTRAAGQQAVSDIADAVMAGRGAGSLPPGSLPSLLAGQTSPLLEGDVARALNVRGSAGYLPPGVMPGQAELLGGQDLFRQGAQQVDPALADWAQRLLSGRQIGNLAQAGLPTAGEGAGGLIEDLLAGQRGAPYQPQQTLGTFQQALARGEGGTPGLLDELLNAIDPAQRGAPYQPQQTLGTFQQALARGEGGLADIIDNLIATPRPQETVPPSLLAQVAGAPGESASKIGSFIASGLSPADNLPPATKAAFQKFAATVGSNSEAANVWARLRAEAGGLAPDVEQRMAQGLRTQATDDFMQTLRDQKLAAPLGADPAAPGFTAPRGQGWKLASQDAGSPLSRWMVHPSVQGPINAVVGRSAIASHPIGGAYLKLSGTGKANIFNLSNFHAYTTALNSFWSDPQVAANMARAFVSDSFTRGLRGKMANTIGTAADAGVSGMLGRAAPDVEGDLSAMNTALRRGIAGTATGGGSAAAGYAAAKIAGKSDDEARGQALRFGIAGALLGGAPMEVGGRGTVAEELGKALWERAMPIAKASVWKALTDGGMDAGTAAQVTNERFGGLNYAMMGRSPTLQDALRMSVISPDYLESTLRQAGRAIGGAGTGEARGFLGKSLGGMMAVTELVNHALTGHWTDQNQDGHHFEVEMQDPNGGYSHTGLIAGNYLSFLNLADKLKTDTSAKVGADLTNFATGRAAPLLGTLAEAVQAARSTNSLTQPYGYGKAGPASILSNLAPIGISQVAEGMNSGGISPEAAVILAALGLNPRYTNPTTAAGTTASAAARAAASAGGGPSVRPAPTIRPAATPRAAPTPRPAR